MIACRECGTKNPAGSKFCNNCGSPLPPATKLICPNCQAANAATLLYCDNCGTRLVDTNLPESTPDTPSSDLGRSLERFSLPSRPPGETANLDVVGEIPDWLKTGNTARQPQEFSWSEEEPPTEESEEATPPAAPEPWLDMDQPAYRPGDDLPDWLMDEASREAFLSGREKSTDELFAAVQRERQRRVEQEALPDWLSGLGDEPAVPEEAPPDDAPLNTSAKQPAVVPPPEEDLPAWLLDIEETLDEAIAGDDIPDDTVVEEASAGEATLEQPVTSETLPAEPTPTDSTVDEILPSDIGWQEEEIVLPALDDDTWLDEISELADEEVDGTGTPAWLLDVEPEEEPAGWPDDKPATESIADIPDWLLDLEEEEPAEDLLTEEGLPGWLANLVDSEAGSLPHTEEPEATEEPGDIELPAEEASPTPPQPAEQELEGEDDFAAWLAQMDVAPPPAETARPRQTQPLPDDLPSWLSESIDELPADEFEGTEATYEYEEESVEVVEPPAGEPDDEPAEELPEWLEEILGDAGADEPAAQPGPFGVTGELRDIPSQLAGEGLPDWLEQDLQALPSDSADTFSAEAPSEVPDWLQPVRQARPEEVLDLGESAADAEWSDLLASLPAPGEQSLSEAPLPEWLEALRPGDLSPAGADENGSVESEGPLAGLRGVVHIEPVVVRPQAAERPVAHLEMSREQQQQVALLRQLMAEERKPPVPVVKPGRLALGPAAQLLLALLLLAAVLVGLFMPPLVQTVLPEAPAAVQAQQAINAAAGRPVLVVFEYSPAMAGELTPQARQILEWLAANDSSAVLTSQSAAGITLGEQIASEVVGLNSQSLGFLPGEALGLRQLTGCLQASVDCEQLYGRDVDSTLRTTLQELGLIVVLAAERDSLVSWVEQVAAFSDLPVVAAVTQSLAPIAAPYYATGQFDGLIAGLPALAQVATPDAPGIDLDTRLWAVTLGQWLIVVLLVVGNLFWLLKGALARR